MIPIKKNKHFSMNFNFNFGKKNKCIKTNVFLIDIFPTQLFGKGLQTRGVSSRYRESPKKKKTTVYRIKNFRFMF